MATNVFAIGPRSSQVTDQIGMWIRAELGRCVGRLQRRHGALTAMVSLAPGIGMWWYEAARLHGIPIDSWAIHQKMGQGWPDSMRVEFNSVIANSQGFRVAFPTGDQMKPLMHYGHYKQMIAGSDVVIAAWDGNRDSWMAEIIQKAEKPIFLLDHSKKRVQWMPDGYTA